MADRTKPSTPVPVSALVRSQVPATEVRAGDFTVFSGFRYVVSVEVDEQSEGRGRKKRTWIAAVLITRADGTVDSVAPEQLVTVRRPAPVEAA